MRIARKIRRIPKVLFVVIGLTSFYLIFLYAANYRESVLIELYDDDEITFQTQKPKDDKQITKLIEHSNEINNKINDLKKLLQNNENKKQRDSQILDVKYNDNLMPYKAVQFVSKSLDKDYEQPEQPEQLEEQWDHEKEAMAGNRIIIERTTPEQIINNEQPVIEVEKSSREKEMEKYLNMKENNIEELEKLKKFEQLSQNREGEQFQNEPEFGDKQKKEENELVKFNEINNENIDDNVMLNENIKNIDVENRELNHENQGNIENINDDLFDHENNDNNEILDIDKRDLKASTGYKSRKIYDEKEVTEEDINEIVKVTTERYNIINAKNTLKNLLINLKAENDKQNNKMRINIKNENNDLNILHHDIENLNLKFVTSLEEDDTRTKILKDWVAKPSATNRTSILSNLLIYNRVPKCGSTTFKTLLEKLSSKNHFIHESSKIFGDRFLQGEREQEFVDNLMQNQTKSKLPFSMDRHVCFIDFKKYGYPQPIYINVIRDPIQKFVSTFYYIRSQKRWKNLLNGKQSPSDLKNLLNYHKDSMPPEAFEQGKLMMPYDWWMNKTLSECVLSGDKECKYETGVSKETTVAFLCGGEPHCRIVNGASALQQAKYNVETQYSVVGIVEHIVETMTVMEHYIPRYLKGMTKTYKSLDAKYRQGNKTPHPDPPNEVREILLNNLVGDIEIYNFAKQKLYLQYKHIQSMRKRGKKF